MNFNKVNRFENMDELVNGFEPDTNEKFGDDIEEILTTEESIISNENNSVEKIEDIEEGFNLKGETTVEPVESTTPRKVGRPKKPKNKKRDNNVDVYVSEEIYQYLIKRREREDRSLSYIRNKIFENRVNKEIEGGF